MYQPEKLQEQLADLVGFTQPFDPNYPQIDASLTTSQSGIYVSHPMCTIEILREAAPAFKNYSYTLWVSGTNYKKDNWIAYGGKVYKAKNDINNSVIAPNNDATNWIEIDPFSEWLAGIRKQSIVSLIAEFVKRRKYNQVAKSLAEISQMYEGPGRIDDRIIKEGRFVGFEFRLQPGIGLTLRLDKIGFQATQGQDELLFYIYHSSQYEPLEIIPLSVAASTSFSWSAVLNKLISYLGAGTSSQGVFYIGYYEYDLEGQAIQKKVDVSRSPCLSCSNFDLMQYNAWSKYATFRSISVPSTAFPGTGDLFDVSQVKHTPGSNYGINLSFAIYCDLTDVFISNKLIIADAMKAQLELNLLTEVGMSTRMSTNTEQTKKTALAELDDNPDSGSYKAQYHRMLEAMDFDFSGLSGACLPCDNRRKMKFKAI